MKNLLRSFLSRLLAKNLVYVSVALVCPAVTAADQQIVPFGKRPKPPYRIWQSLPPEDCPFENSRSIVGIAFTGRHTAYTGADTWYPSWASDGNLYSPWTDGTVGAHNSFSGGTNATTGQAKIIGDDPLKLQVVSLGLHKASPAPYGGRYPCGSLVYNGIWYYGTYCLDSGPAGLNWEILGPFVGFRVSTDLGLTWTDTPHTPGKPLFGESGKMGGKIKIGAPHFVDFGQDMKYSPDGKAYLVGHGATDPDPKPRPANLSWVTGDQIYLARVTPSIQTINDMSKYEFFAGYDTLGNPRWTDELSKIKPLIDWNNRCGCVTMTYNVPLKKYLMCVTDGWPTIKTMDTYILESDHVTGPWKLVSFMQHFGEQAYFVNFPSKFISADGRTAWLCYANNFTRDQKFNPRGGKYAMTLQEVRLLSPDDPKPDTNNPLLSSRNVAQNAKITATSTHPDYNLYAVVDGAVDGYPGDISCEWASHGESTTAVLRLTWDDPQTVNRVWLFDRPNQLDQVTSGMLVFSDETTISVGELPDNASGARQISFPAKTINWMIFVVSSVKPGSPNIGLSEIAVFSSD